MAAWTSNRFKFQKETITPGTFADVIQCISVSLPKTERNTKAIYVADSDSPIILKSTLKEKEIEAQFLWDPAAVDHLAFKTDADAGTTRNYKIILPDTGAYAVTINAFITDIDYEKLDAEGKELLMNVKFMLTAPETIVP